MRWLPPLNALRTFEAVGRLHNVKEAAWELNVSPAAVNHQVRVLEQHLGVDLFARTRAGLVLTSEGKKFFDYVSFALDHVMRGYREVGNHEGRNRLVIESTPSFAFDYLLPRLRKFQIAHPEILLEVNSQPQGLHEINFSESAVDVTIRGGTEDSSWVGLHAELLLRPNLTPVCSPSLLKGPIPLETPADLARHTLLIPGSMATGWDQWIAAATAQGHDMSGIDPARGMYFNQVHMPTIVALSGLGVDLGRIPMVSEHLRKGTLVAPFDIKVQQAVSYWLICPRKNAESDAVRAFCAWLHKELELDGMGAPPQKADSTVSKSPKLKIV